MSIRDVLRYCNDTDTISLMTVQWDRLESHEYAKITSPFTRIYSEILHKTVTNTSKASMSHVRIKGNLWLFLTICETFSLK